MESSTAWPNPKNAWKLTPNLTIPRKRWAIGLGGLSVFLFVMHSLLARGQWERDNTVELCVDGSEVQVLTDQNDSDTWQMLENCRSAGVSSVAVYWDPMRPLGDLMQEWSPRIPEGLSLTLRPEPVAFSDWSRGWPLNARPLRRGPTVRNVLFSGETVMGYPDLSLVKNWVADTDYHLPWIEFTRQKGLASLQRSFPDRLVRAHGLSEEEMPLVRPSAVIHRLRRAVRERGARFLYVRLFPSLTRAQNESFIVDLAQQFRTDGWRLGPAAARFGEWPASLVSMAPGLRLFLAFGASVVLPLLAFYWALRQRSVVWPAIAMGGAGLMTGLLVAAFLSTPFFALGFSVFRGVKLALLLPLGTALFSLYRGDEIRHFMNENVTVGRLVLGGAVLGGVMYFILRTGHGTVADASSVELSIRGHLESLLGIRPRFKEFLIGHPLLWVGFYLRKKVSQGAPFLPLGRSAFAQAVHFIFHDPRPFLLVGLIGPLSIVNTFCHAHTPLWVSLIRTCHGVWMGAAFGGLFIAGLKWAEGRWHRIP